MHNKPLESLSQAEQLQKLMNAEGEGTKGERREIKSGKQLRRERRKKERLKY